MLTTLLAIGILLLANTSNAATKLSRPENDCVPSNAVTAASVDGVLFYPPAFQTTGSVVSQNNRITQVTNAIGFDVTYTGNLKIVNNTEAGEVYVLYQCGTPPPDKNSIPAGAKVFSIPLTSVVVPDTTAYAFVNALGLDLRIAAVSDLAVNPCAQKLQGCNRAINTLNLDSTNTTALKLEFGPLSDAVLNTIPDDLETSITISAPTDPGPLNRAEWIKFVSLFFNLESEANALFDNITSQYNALEDEADAIPQNPLVAFVSYFSFGTQESYQLSFAPYKQQLVDDASGRVLNYTTIASIPGVTPSAFSPGSILEFAWGKNNTFASRQDAAAALQKVLSNVDVVIDETYVMDPQSYNMTTFMTNLLYTSPPTTAPWYANRNALRVDGLVDPDGGLDWFESAIVRPDRVLGDLVGAMYPELKANTTSTWFRNIARGQVPIVADANKCTLITSCNVAPTPICPYVKLCGGGKVQQRLESAGACSYSACA